MERESKPEREAQINQLRELVDQLLTDLEGKNLDIPFNKLPGILNTAPNAKIKFTRRLSNFNGGDYVGVTVPGEKMPGDPTTELHNQIETNQFLGCPEITKLAYGVIDTLPNTSDYTRNALKDLYKELFK